MLSLNHRKKEAASDLYPLAYKAVFDHTLLN